MNDKTLGEYKRTTPDPDETTGEALARLQAEMTRLLDEADAELRDEADGGVAAALIEQEDGVDAAASRLAAFARKFGVPPEWTTAPAVQAWHRSDHRTEHDGTPGQPRIWSPDYKTTETWSTPSLRNVHWSDLVDVTPLAPVRGCPDPDEHVRYDAALADAEKAERGLHQAQSGRDELRSLYEGQIEVIGRLQRAAESRPLTPDAITDEMVERARQAYNALYPSGAWSGGIRAALEAVLIAPARPEGAEELGELIGTWTATEDIAPAQLPTGSLATLADFLAEHGVRVDGGEDPR